MCLLWLSGKFTAVEQNFVGQFWENEVSPYQFSNIKSQIIPRQWNDWEVILVSSSERGIREILLK